MLIRRPGHAEGRVHAGEEGLARRAGEGGLADAVVVEVVCAHHSAPPPKEGGDELGEAVELVHAGSTGIVRSRQKCFTEA
eukprot:4632476-Prymnesium_polylepis.1